MYILHLKRKKESKTLDRFN